MRNVPDVSFDADPNTGYNIYVQGSFQVYGGTSCAAPIWAGFTALVNNYRSVSLNAGRIGFVNPVLYSLGKRSDYNYYFHDIKDGSTNGYYPAVSGYDLATGWGTIKGQALLVGMGGCPQGEYLSNGNCVTTVTSSPILSGISTPRPTLRTNVPTIKATQSPVSTGKPTIKTSPPTIKVTSKPTAQTSAPVMQVTAKPTIRTQSPTIKVTNEPTVKTNVPTVKATSNPTVKTNVPTVKITNSPITSTPTKQVTAKPTLKQTNKPTVQPIQAKTSSPSFTEYEYGVAG